MAPYKAFWPGLDIRAVSIPWESPYHLEAMTTTVQLEKYSVPILLPVLRPYGFEHPSKLLYWRKAGEVYHFISLGFYRGGESIFVDVFPWMPRKTTNMEDFPNCVKGYIAGGRMGRHGDVGPNAMQWRVSTKDEAEYSLRQIGNLLERKVIPWLEEIATFEAYLERIQPDLRHAVDGTDVAKNILRTSKVDE